MEDKLKPCPFCGSTKVHLDTNGQRTWVICLGCGAKSGGAYNGRTAAEKVTGLWNRRAYDIHGDECKRG